MYDTYIQIEFHKLQQKIEDYHSLHSFSQDGICHVCKVQNHANIVLYIDGRTNICYVNTAVARDVVWQAIESVDKFVRICTIETMCWFYRWLYSKTWPRRHHTAALTMCTRDRYDDMTSPAGDTRLLLLSLWRHDLAGDTRLLLLSLWRHDLIRRRHATVALLAMTPWPLPPVTLWVLWFFFSNIH